MNDIVERLRVPVMFHGADANGRPEQTNAERREAADLMERLRAALKTCERAALKTCERTALGSGKRRSIGCGRLYVMCWKTLRITNG